MLCDSKKSCALFAVFLLLAVIVIDGLGFLNQGWGDPGLLVFLTFMNVFLAIFSYQSSLVAERFVHKLLMLALVNMPYVLALALMELHQLNSQLYVAGIMTGFCITVLSACYGALVLSSQIASANS